jgi:hypothetical protein
MAKISRDQIESALPRKGFVREDSSHRYFYHEYYGKRTGVITFTSHGSEYKDYGDTLLKLMKRQLRLDTTRDLSMLLLCQIDGDGYNDILRQKGIIKDQENRKQRQ